jgi:hypothetical protein
VTLGSGDKLGAGGVQRHPDLSRRPAAATAAAEAELAEVLARHQRAEGISMAAKAWLVAALA